MQENYKKQSEPNETFKTEDMNPVNSRIPNQRMPSVEAEDFGMD